MILSNVPRRAPLLVAVLLLAAATASAGPGWVRLGPEGGYVTSLAAGAPGSGVLLASALDGGMYRSEDFGATWAPWAPGFGACLVMVQGARDGRSLLAYVDKGSLDTQRTFASEDGGLTWRAVTLTDPDPPEGFTARPGRFRQAASDPSVVYALASLANLTESEQTLYRSADRGDTWQRLPALTGNWLQYLEVSDGDPDELTTWVEGTNYLSRDGGLTWQPLLYQGKPIEYEPRFSPFRSGWMYTFVDAGYSTLVRSTDYGVTWQAVPLEAGHAPYDGGIRLILDDGDSETVYVGGQGGLIRAAGGRSTWISKPLAGGVTGLVADPADPKRLAEGAGNGILRTSDGGGTWTTETTGLTATSMRLVFAPPAASGGLFAADVATLYRRREDGTWTPSVTFHTDPGQVEYPPYPPYAPAVAAAAPPGVIYLAADGIVRLSTDGGATWEERSEGILIDDLAVNPRHPADAWAATQSGLFRTLDGGLHWDPVDTGEEAHPVSVAVDPDHPDHVLVGLWENPPPWDHAVPVVLSSPDAGATWQRGGIQLAVEAAGFAFPRGSSVVLAATPAGVFRSGDGGLSWSPSSEGMDIQCAWTPGGPDNPGEYACTDSAGSIARDPVRAGTVYASTERGVWRSSDAGASWTLMEPVLGPWGPYPISVAPDGSRLYAATQGSGVLALDLAAYQPIPEERTVRRRVGRTR